MLSYFKCHLYIAVHLVPRRLRLLVAAYSLGVVPVPQHSARRNRLGSGLVQLVASTLKPIRRPLGLSLQQRPLRVAPDYLVEEEQRVRSGHQLKTRLGRQLMPVQEGLRLARRVLDSSAAARPRRLDLLPVVDQLDSVLRLPCFLPLVLLVVSRAL